jgi:hypothetical protein
MAEFAQRSIEEMLVEAEKMKKIGLFTHEEIRFFNHFIYFF